MQIFTKEDYYENKQEVVKRIRSGEIFIYPTDTIYGIGCDATNFAAVQKIRNTKHNFLRPFSVMVPDKEWIRECCEMTGKSDDWIEKLPGPFTLILPMKENIVSENITDTGNLGVRIPDIWSSELAKLAGVPIVSTSANLSGGLFMTSFETLNDEVKKHIDFMINVGEVRGRPSTIVNLVDEQPQVIER